MGEDVAEADAERVNSGIAYWVKAVSRIQATSRRRAAMATGDTSAKETS
jgi:hypothetical protein